MPDDFTAEPPPWPAEPTTIQAEASGLPASRLDIEQKRPKPWNFRLIGKLTILSIVLVAIALVTWGFTFGKTTYALASTKLEILFIVTDAETGEPIPLASVDLLVEQHDKGFMQQAQVITLVTDKDGKASYVRDNNSCEYIIRPFRKTVTALDLTWATVSVSANGYDPVGPLWLHTVKRDNEAYVDGGLRVEFRVPLTKETEK